MTCRVPVGSTEQRGLRPALAFCAADAINGSRARFRPDPAPEGIVEQPAYLPDGIQLRCLPCQFRVSARVKLRIAHLTRGRLTVLALRLSAPIPSSSTAAPGSAAISRIS